jgi:hypothetical protein
MPVPKYNSFIQGGGSHNRNSYSCVCLHGDRKPPERKANLERFKKQEAKFLICTDVAARGLDIIGLPFSKYRECLYSSSSSGRTFHMPISNHLSGNSIVLFCQVCIFI